MSDNNSETALAALSSLSLDRQDQTEVDPYVIAAVLEACPEVELRVVEGKGRGLFWNPNNKKPLVKGTTIMSLQPDILIPDDPNIRTGCHVCIKKVGKEGDLICCSGCKVVHYCSKSCMKIDESVHRHECKAISSYQIRHYGSASKAAGQEIMLPSTHIRAAARLIWQRQTRGEDWWKAINSLMSQSEERRGESNPAGAELAKYLCGVEDANQAVEINDYLRKLGISGMKELKKIYYLFGRNAYTAQYLTMGGVGTALSLVGSFYNHSCAANISLAYPTGCTTKRGMHFVAIKDIQVGEELTIGYIEGTLPYHLRQADLLRRYHFTCTCSLCTRGKEFQEDATTEVDIREALYCGRPECSGLVAFDWTHKKPKGLCTACKQPCILDPRTVVATLDEGIGILNILNGYKYGVKQGTMSTGPTPEECSFLQSCQASFKALTAILPPSSHPLLALLCGTKPLITRQWEFHAAKGKHQEASKYYREEYLIQNLIKQGCEAEKDTVYPKGDPVRISALFSFNQLVCKLASLNQGDESWTKPSSSLFFSRLPKMSPPTREYGFKLLLQFVDELKIGYGTDATESPFYNLVVAADVKPHMEYLLKLNERMASIPSA